MRLLLVSLHYAPEMTGNAPYATGIAEHWVRHGHRVVVLTGLPHYPARRVRDGYRGRPWRSESINGVRVLRRWNFVPARQSALKRGLFEASSLLTGLSALALPRPHALLGVVPSLADGILARLAAWRFRVPYGLVFQDLMGRSAEQSGVSGGRRAAGAVVGAEAWATRGAAAVGIIAEGFRPYVHSLGIEPARVRLVRNWTHTAQAKIGRTAVRKRLGLSQDAVVCLHAGNMGHKQGLENLLECARLAVGSARHLLFVLIGDGSQRPYLEALAARYSLSNLRLLPVQPSDIFPSVLAAADILLVNQRAGVTDMSLPSKLTSYFAVGRPVVAAVESASEAAREIEASGGGLVVVPDEPRAMLSALCSLAGNPTLSAQLGDSAQAWALGPLSKAAAMESYDGLLASVIGASEHGIQRAEQHIEVMT